MRSGAERLARVLVDYLPTLPGPRFPLIEGEAQEVAEAVVLLDPSLICPAPAHHALLVAAREYIEADTRSWHIYAHDEGSEWTDCREGDCREARDFIARIAAAGDEI